MDNCSYPADPGRQRNPVLHMKVPTPCTPNPLLDGSAYVVEDDPVVVHGVWALGRQLGSVEMPDLLKSPEGPLGLLLFQVEAVGQMNPGDV